MSITTCCVIVPPGSRGRLPALTLEGERSAAPLPCLIEIEMYAGVESRAEKPVLHPAPETIC